MVWTKRTKSGGVKIKYGARRRYNRTFKYGAKNPVWIPRSSGTVSAWTKRS